VAGVAWNFKQGPGIWLHCMRRMHSPHCVKCRHPTQANCIKKYASACVAYDVCVRFGWKPHLTNRYLRVDTWWGCSHWNSHIIGYDVIINTSYLICTRQHNKALKLWQQTEELDGCFCLVNYTDGIVVRKTGTSTCYIYNKLRRDTSDYSTQLKEHVRTQVLTPQWPHLFNRTTYETTHLLLHVLIYLQFRSGRLCYHTRYPGATKTYLNVL